MKKNQEVVHKIINYIDEHKSEKLKLDQIADFAGYSKYHVNRVFSDIMGVTIHQYILQYRLKEAAKLLLETDRPIIEIAYDSGYETQQSFHFAFKKIYQMSPAIYRKQYRYNNTLLTLINITGHNITEFNCMSYSKLLYRKGGIAA